MMLILCGWANFVWWGQGERGGEASFCSAYTACENRFVSAFIHRLWTICMDFRHIKCTKSKSEEVCMQKGATIQTNEKCREPMRASVSSKRTTCFNFWFFRLTDDKTIASLLPRGVRRIRLNWQWFFGNLLLLSHVTESTNCPPQSIVFGLGRHILYTFCHSLSITNSLRNDRFRQAKNASLLF